MDAVGAAVMAGYRVGLPAVGADRFIAQIAEADAVITEQMTAAVTGEDALIRDDVVAVVTETALPVFETDVGGIGVVGPQHRSDRQEGIAYTPLL